MRHYLNFYSELADSDNAHAEPSRIETALFDHVARHNCTSAPRVRRRRGALGFKAKGVCVLDLPMKLECVPNLVNIASSQPDLLHESFDLVNSVQC